MVDVNYLAVLGAAIVGTMIGGIWYGPLFGKRWMQLSGMTREQINAAKKSGMGKLYALQFVGTLVMSFVLSHALVFASAYLDSEGLSAGLTSGFWNWIGFIAPVTLGTVLWEGKSWKLWVFNNGYYLVSLSAMGVMLALWK